MSSSKWQQHIECTRIIRRHPDWTDDQVLEAAGLRPLEVNIVQEARREVDTETVAPSVRSSRSY